MVWLNQQPNQPQSPESASLCSHQLTGSHQGRLWVSLNQTPRPKRKKKKKISAVNCKNSPIDLTPVLNCNSLAGILMKLISLPNLRQLLWSTACWSNCDCVTSSHNRHNPAVRRLLLRVAHFVFSVSEGKNKTNPINYSCNQHVFDCSWKLINAAFYPLRGQSPCV